MACEILWFNLLSNTDQTFRQKNLQTSLEETRQILCYLVVLFWRLFLLFWGFFCCFVCVLFLNQVFQSSFIIYREKWTKLINYSAIVIPGFLSEIATLQVFLGAACSLAGWGAAQTLLVSTLSYGTCFLSCAFNMSGMPSLYVFPA